MFLSALVLTFPFPLFFRSAKDAFVAPVATGMGVALCLMALKRQRPGSKYVIWSRVDQKSCFKAILTSGLEPVIMSLIKHGDELRTDTHTLEDVVNIHGGADAICAIVTATSVFAPRVADDVPAGKQSPDQTNNHNYSWTWLKS